MSRLTKNIAYNLLGQAGVLVLGFISVKYVYKLLGGDIVGIIYFAMMANATICMVLELGVCSAAVKEISAHHETAPFYIRDFIRTFSSLYWILYFIAAAVIYMSASVIAKHWINLGDLSPESAEQSLRILLISALLSLPKSFYAAVLRGLT